MAAPFPRSCVFLHCPATFQHPRIDPTFPSTVFLDCIIRHSPSETADTVCSIRYNKKRNNEEVACGCYCVFVKVNPPFCLLFVSNLLNIVQIATYQPNVHLQSPVRNDNDFTLIGELLDVLTFPQNPNEHAKPLHQLHPLPFDPEYRLGTTTAATRLTVTGTVSAVQREHLSFSVAISQAISGAVPVPQISIRAIFTVNARWPRPAERLPLIGSILTFSGDFVAVEDHTAVVILDEITYLRPPLHHAFHHGIHV
jgi:hypothetical protein